MSPGKNKILITLSLVTLIISGILPGCGKPPAAEITMDVGRCADMLLETIAFRDVLTAISDEMSGALFQISGQDVIKQKVYVSSGATAEEIAVFEAADIEAAERIEGAVLQRVADQRASFTDYLPAELPKLDDPFLMVRDKYVILCLSDDNERARAELNRFIGLNE